jgi:hypothetical protein
MPSKLEKKKVPKPFNHELRLSKATVDRTDQKFLVEPFFILRSLTRISSYFSTLSASATPFKRATKMEAERS